MPLGCWLSLVPATDDLPPSSEPSSTATSPTRSSQSSDSPTTPTQPTTFIPFKKAQTAHNQHNHNHHPSPNSFLKPMVLHSPPRRNKKSDNQSSSNPFHVLPLLENNSNQSSHPRSCFEVRSLQVCDIEKVRELHCATLPVTYPSCFFYSLLGSDPNEKISLVATLPSTSVHGYFDVLSSLSHHPSSHLASSPAHHSHLAHHHVTSPLSGRKPISLDVVGTITARLSSPTTPTGSPTVRILTLCVSPSYRRFGVGRLLLDSLLKQIKNRFSRLAALSPHPHPSTRQITVNLHVQATNKVAHAFYTRAGFSSVCFKPAYYSEHPLKPLDPALKHPSLPPSRPQKHSMGTPDTLTPDDSDSETEDVDAWLLELSIDSC